MIMISFFWKSNKILIVVIINFLWLYIYVYKYDYFFYLLWLWLLFDEIYVDNNVWCKIKKEIKYFICYELF